MRQPTRKPFTAREFYMLLVLVLSSNMLLWLDSFDRYLSSRYHFYLSQYVPEQAYVPSREMQQVLGLGEDSDEVASSDAADDSAGDAGNAAVSGDAGDDMPPSSAASMVEASPVLSAASSPAPAVAVQAATSPASAPLVAASAPAAVRPEGEVVAAVSAPAAAAVSAPAGMVVPARIASAQAASSPAAGGRQAQVAEGPRILFAGDSMMQGVAPIVISRLRRAYPHGRYVDASKESTGLTVKRYFDWPTRIKDECLSQGLDTVVIFLGPNDPWDIYEHRHRYVFPSDKWEQKYRSRVDEVLDFATAKGLRVIWIGLPVMRDDRIEQGAMIENKIFQEETKKYSFEYMPTGDLLGTVGEPYKKYIEDPKKGKIVVRANDGVHFTSKGLRMISSRVEELLKKQDKL